MVGPPSAHSERNSRLNSSGRSTGKKSLAPASSTERTFPGWSWPAIEPRPHVILGVTGIADPWDIVRAGVDAFLTECGQPDFRRIALEEAPAALGWTRWKELEENYFLGLVKASLQGLAQDGLIDIPSDDLTARMFLAATGEAGLAVGAAANPDEERERAGRLVMRFLEGLH